MCGVARLEAETVQRWASARGRRRPRPGSGTRPRPSRGAIRLEAESVTRRARFKADALARRCWAGGRSRLAVGLDSRPKSELSRASVLGPVGRTAGPGSRSYSGVARLGAESVSAGLGSRPRPFCVGARLEAEGVARQCLARGRGRPAAGIDSRLRWSRSGARFESKVRPAARLCSMARPSHGGAGIEAETVPRRACLESEVVPRRGSARRQGRPVAWNGSRPRLSRGGSRLEAEAVSRQALLEAEAVARRASARVRGRPLANFASRRMPSRGGTRLDAESVIRLAQPKVEAESVARWVWVRGRGRPVAGQGSNLRSSQVRPWLKADDLPHRGADRDRGRLETALWSREMKRHGVVRVDAEAVARRPQLEDEGSA